MMSLTFRITGATLAAALAFTPALGRAQESPPAPPATETPPAVEPAAPTPPPWKWKASAEAGYLLASGNTKSQSVTGKLRGSVEHGPWLFEAGGDSVFTKAEVRIPVAAPPPPFIPYEKTTAFRITANGKTNLAITDRQYLYALGGYEHDRFSGFKYQFTESGGYGVKILDDAKLKLKIEAGPAGRHVRKEQDYRKNDIAGRGALSFLWTIRDGVEFHEDANTVAGRKASGGVVTESVTALSSNLGGGFGLKLSYKLKHTSKPALDYYADAPSNTVPVLKKEVDATTSATLVYTYP